MSHASDWLVLSCNHSCASHTPQSHPPTQTEICCVSLCVYVCVCWLLPFQKLDNTRTACLSSWVYLGLLSLTGLSKQTCQFWGKTHFWYCVCIQCCCWRNLVWFLHVIWQKMVGYKNSRCSRWWNVTKVRRCFKWLFPFSASLYL